MKRVAMIAAAVLSLLRVPGPAAAQTAPTAVLFVHAGGETELPFDGFQSSCAGYGIAGVRYSTPAGPVTVDWGSVEYILPQWEEGRTKAGAVFKTEALRPGLCPDGAAHKITKKTVKVKKKTKTVEEVTRYPLYGMHVIAFSREGLEKGTLALAQKGAVFDQDTGMEFILVKGGCFERGDNTGEGEENERYLQRVCLDDFLMAKYEVTQALWQSIVHANPSGHPACGENCPVENVTWYDVQDFIRLLNQRTGRIYRLPTEAEWEFAARSGGRLETWAGTNAEAAVGDSAWYVGNSNGRTHPVGMKYPNAIGLYDMSGNVTEWTADRYDKDCYRAGFQKNPSGPSNGDHRVSRGGNFRYGPNKVRTGFRDHDNPSTKNTAMGFRLIMGRN